MKTETKVMGIPTFVFDYSVLKTILEGKKDASTKIIDRIRKMKNEGIEFKCFTTSANFHHALFIAKKIDIVRLHDIMELVVIAPSIHTNFKDRESVLKDMICFAEAMTMSQKILEGIKKGCLK
jgi:hypothetical protein